MIKSVLAAILARILWIFLWTISLLPLRILYIFGDIFAWFQSHVLFYRSDIIDDNLDYSFPGKHSEELAIIKTKYYKYLGELIAEVIKSSSAGKSFYQKHLLIDEETLFIMRQIKLRNKNALILTGHIGNWEWAAKALSIHSEKLPVYIIYRHLSSKIFDKLVQIIRTSNGLTLIDYKKIIALKNIKDTSIITMVPDQSPTGIKQVDWQNFLSQNTAFTTSPTRIARLLDAQTYYCYNIRLKRGLYKISLLPIDHEISTYIHNLEKNIKEVPHTWLWSHRRWKIKKNN